MTVCDLRMRQKQSFGSWSPIQYLPLWSFQLSETPSILIPTGSLLTTSPTATSSLLLGFAMYVFLGCGIFFWGVEPLGSVPREYLGARDQVDVEVEARDGFKRETDEVSETLGEPVRLGGFVAVRERNGVPEVRRIGLAVEPVKLVVRCREAKVEPNSENPPDGPDTEREEDRLDNWLSGRLRDSVEPEITRRALG